MRSVFVTRLPTVYGNALAGQADDRARMVFDLMQAHTQQGRKVMVWDDALAAIAQTKNMRQAHEGWTGHVDPQGHGPNAMLRAAGYPLPDWYSHDARANNVESLGRGGNGGDVMQMWHTFMSSSAHAAHLLATYSFYAAQTQVGVAYYHLEDSESVHWWCVLSSHPG